MQKRSLLSSIAVAAVLLSASPAWANHEGVPVYRTNMYSDASKTTQVGSIEFSYCTYYAQSDGVQYHLEGTYTNYQDSELIGWCSEWNFGPLHADS